MKKMQLILLALLLLLAGCCTPGREAPSVGEPLNREEQSSLYAQRLEEQGDVTASAKGKVYWTPNGTKYHASQSCSYLKNAQEVLSGTAAEAANHGASQPCSRCAQE
ncbi:MAG: hypothetical protein J6S28_11540 [Clostridia bacterium]|nr:hypothetical protein [Clostridia bacterium]MBO7296461.1 hypothetical protein [Clostridia bacterium]